MKKYIDVFNNYGVEITDKIKTYNKIIKEYDWIGCAGQVDGTNSRGRTTKIETPDGQIRIVIYYNGEVSVLAHEAYHAMMYIANLHDIQDEEFIAYGVQKIIKEVMEK